MIDVKTCPNCGSDRIRRVRRTVRRSSRGQSFTVPNVTFHECPACGEQVYGREAMQKIEAHRPRVAKASA